MWKYCINEIIDNTFFLFITNYHGTLFLVITESWFDGILKFCKYWAPINNYTVLQYNEFIFYVNKIYIYISLFYIYKYKYILLVRYLIIATK